MGQTTPSSLPLTCVTHGSGETGALSWAYSFTVRNSHRKADSLSRVLEDLFDRPGELNSAHHLLLLLLGQIGR